MHINLLEYILLYEILWVIVVTLVQFTLKSSPWFYSVRVLQFKGILCNQSEQFNKNNYYCNHFQQELGLYMYNYTYTCTTHNHPHYNKVLSGKIKKSKINESVKST